MGVNSLKGQTGAMARARSVRTLHICRRPSEKRTVVHSYKSPLLRLVRRESKLDTGCPSVHGAERPVVMGVSTTITLPSIQ